MLHDLDAELRIRRDRGLFRTLATLEAIDGPRIKLAGRWLVNWSSNDYLGLSQHPALIRAAAAAMRRWGVGARASRLLAGSTAAHDELESALARFFRTEAALVFPSGYQANLGTLAALAGRGDVILIDRLCHASLVDAARASGASLRVFHHNDANHAAALLRRYRGRRTVIVTEGVFSMDGDRAPLADLVRAADRAGAIVYLDDAHGAFATGRTGRGSPEQAGVPQGRFFYMATLGKALGCQGGFIAGPRALIDAIRNHARAFIYTTALAVPIAAAAARAIAIVDETPALRARLAQRSQRLCERLSRVGRVPENFLSHIVPLVIGDSARASALASRLREQGIFAPAIRPPTVPVGAARLRLSVTAAHTNEQIDQLVASLGLK